MISKEERPSVVNGALIFNEMGEIFLAKSKKWENQFTVPGGHIEFGEKLENAVKREVKEETNLDIDEVKFLSIDETIFPNDYKRDKKEKRHLIFLNYIAKCKKSNKISLNEEFSEYIWINPKEALSLNIRPSVRKLIEEFLKKNMNEVINGN